MGVPKGGGVINSFSNLESLLWNFLNFNEASAKCCLASGKQLAYECDVIVDRSISVLN